MPRLEPAGIPPHVPVISPDSASNYASQFKAGPLDLKLHNFVLSGQGSGPRKYDPSKYFNFAQL